MKRGVTARLIALAFVVLAGCGYTAFDVIGWRIGAQRFHVTVMLPRAGGVYPEADVTYRGVSVGRVTGLRLAPSGVAVELSINPGVHIPANATASVRELSAVGEQYMDLIPAGPDSTSLHAGSVIPMSRATVPTSVDASLIDFGKLLSAINTKDIETLNKALAAGFGGVGNDLRSTITAGNTLIGALQAAQPATVDLQVGGQKVLTTAVDTSSQFAQFTNNLASLTAQLSKSNGDFQALLTNGIAAENQFIQLNNQTASSFESFITTQATIFDTLAARNPAVQALFQVLPVFAGQLATVSSGGSLRGELFFNTANTVCPYIPGSQTPNPLQATGAPNLDLNCTTSAPDMLQRGAATAPGPPGG